MRVLMPLLGRLVDGQDTVEQAARGQIDPNTLTPSQLSVEKLIKEQNFNWKV